MNISRGTWRYATIGALTAGLLLPMVGQAQTDSFGYGTPDNPGEIDFDRPESWAMKYFTAVSLMTGLGVPGAVGEGNITIGFEGGFIPTLSDEQRTVGFNGTKREDLNKSSAFGRVRLTLGLTGDAEFTLAYVPPVELNGATPNLFAAAIGVPFYRTRELRVGARIFGQLGSISGDFTCDEATVAAGTDPVLNPFGCEAISDDRTEQVYVGVEFGAATEVAAAVEPYLTVGLTRFSTKFETNALTAGTLDTSTFETSGFTVHGTAGLLFDVSDRVILSGEVFYMPLGVQRFGETVSSNDGLLNGRGMIRFRF